MLIATGCYYEGYRIRGRLEWGEEDRIETLLERNWREKDLGVGGL